VAKDVYEALLEIQTEGIEGVTKDAKNPHFKNTYITLGKLLEVVCPVLTSKGVLLTQTPTTVGGDGGPGLWTSLTHLESGTSVDGKVPLMLEKNNPQGLGSAITYLRRYALMSMLNLVADEDDDGVAASPITPIIPPSREVVNAESEAGSKPLF
jgi:hypothetical protein